MKWWIGVVALAVAASSCGRRGDAGGNPEQPSPSASVITLGVEMGACDDLAACASECDAGSSDRCRRMGVSYEFGRGVDRDQVHATELYEKACGMDNSEGCLAAGRMYEFHHGVAKNDTKAVAFYERTCDLHNPVGCANLAIMLESGRGTPRDPTRAALLFDQACAKGAGLACEHAKALHASAEGGVPEAGP
jgi:TPR repeat protein